VICTQCGQESPDGFRFCGACGAALAEAPPEREVRKTVTVLFCDVSGSTALGERVDPEVLREIVGRYFDEIRAACERHGGTVEKFIGDAAYAVFGIPQVREDDALRAVRAAGEIRARLPALAEETGVELVFRMGINTGEIVAGEGHTLATGDAVNVGARLEQAAAPGEILLGGETQRLVRDAVEVEPLPPLELKGKSEPVPAYRLVSIDGNAPGLARRPGAPLVGRVRELALLRQAFESAVERRACQLVTVLGPAGVGKSRLIAEFNAGAEGARVIAGRCLNYGEGITFWPLVEALKQLGPEADTTLERFVDVAAGTPAELFWDVRKLLERVARERPLVVVFDDIHWAEPTFLDLIDHIADLSRDAPILLLCVARPELLDDRPGWAGGKLNATTTLLEPLSPAECDRLLDELYDGVAPAVRERIVAASEGNPLFVEEMAALAREDGEVAVPATIQALIAARLDRLGPAERAAIECAAVEGQVFHRSLLGELAGGAPDAPLAALVRKDLIRPALGLDPEEEAYAFRHGLIRDAAYDGLPKARRADLHAQVAGSLPERWPNLVELDELVGYHLEQAHFLRSELGRGDAQLAERAGERLAAAGRTALARQDFPAAVSLLLRAAALLPADDRRIAVLVDAGDPLGQIGRLDEARAVLDEASAGTDDPHLQALARLHVLGFSAFQRESNTLESLIESARQIADEARERGDDPIVAAALALDARLTFWAGRADEASELSAAGWSIAERLGDRRLGDEIRMWWAAARIHGSTGVAESIAFCEEMQRSESVYVRVFGRLFAGEARAMLGAGAQARHEIEAAIGELEQHGLLFLSGASSVPHASVELILADAAGVERAARRGWEILGKLDETGFRASAGGLLAQALVLQDRLEEAEAVLDEVDGFAHADDVEIQMRRRAVRARLLARIGEHERALPLAREAVAAADETDYVTTRTDARLALADVLARAGERRGAVAALEEARAIYERKGHTAGVADATRQLAELLER
jgi:class 3 adenylate cyclase/tetratricopeptide (TPR) repeat protein